MITTTFHQKLVRDRVPARMAAEGIQTETRQLGEQEYRWELANKLEEEGKEAADAYRKLTLGMPSSRAKVLSELADLQYVLSQVAIELGFTALELNAAVCEKLRTHGGFSNRVFLDKSWKETHA